jgi:uncharacterized membrane protein YhaH (DUF805 family)
VLRKYVQFGGRARRAEYWTFVLFNALISLVLAWFETHVHLSFWFTGAYALAVLLPGLAVSVRRLHDSGKPWTRLLLVLVPIAGAVILIVNFARPGQPGENSYGPPPERAKKSQAPLWSIAFFLSVLSVLFGFDFWFKGMPILGIILAFAIPGVLIDLLASFEGAIKGRLKRLSDARP